MEPLKDRPALDVADLPTVAFGPRSPVWLGTILFMLIEGSMMAMIYASYFYYRTRTSDWPPGVLPPNLQWGVANAIAFILSLAPAEWIRRRARAEDLTACRIGLIVLALFGVLNIVLRAFEFANLNCRWSANAYASTIWVLMGVHTGHLLTNFIETVVLAALAFSRRMEATRMPDFDENSVYWYFVVGVALVTDFVVYGASRMF